MPKRIWKSVPSPKPRPRRSSCCRLPKIHSEEFQITDAAGIAGNVFSHAGAAALTGYERQEPGTGKDRRTEPGIAPYAERLMDETIQQTMKGNKIDQL